MAERVLITGGAGFIGSHLAASHRARGDEVHVLVRPGGPFGRSQFLARDVVIHRTRLDDPDALEECLGLARPSIIYHLASGAGRDRVIPLPSARGRLVQDLLNLITLLAAAVDTRPHPRVIVRAGSLAEYGDGPLPSLEHQREAPLTAYTAAMVAGTHYSRMLQPRLPFPVVTARLALTYGPGQSEAYFVPWLVRRCLAGQPSQVRQPLARRDLIHIDDVVEGLQAMAATQLAGGSIVNLSTGIAPTIREVAAKIIAVTGADPALVGFDEEDGEPFSCATIQGVPELAARLLGWSPRISLHDGLGRLVEAVRERIAA